MVDPNRKINRLTEKDIEFLEECEREFSSRYSADDAEFMEHCSKPLDDPPIIENWSTGGDFSRSESDNRHPYRGGNRNARNWRGNFMQRRGRRDQPYANRAFHKEPNSAGSFVKNYKRDYSNFVAASKDD